MTTKKSKKTAKKIKLRAGTPDVIRKLLEKFDGNISAASRAVGKSPGFFGYKNKPEGGGYKEADLIAAQNVLDGQPVPEKSASKFDPEAHTFKLGIVIVVSRAAAFERLYDIGTAMGGHWVLKMSIGSSWLGIIKIIPKEKLQMFAKVAAYDAEKIAAP